MVVIEGQMNWCSVGMKNPLEIFRLSGSSCCGFSLFQSLHLLLVYAPKRAKLTPRTLLELGEYQMLSARIEKIGSLKKRALLLN